MGGDAPRLRASALEAWREANAAEKRFRATPLTTHAEALGVTAEEIAEILAEFGLAQEAREAVA